MSKIKTVRAREVCGRDRFPAIEATVITEDGCVGTAVAAAGSSVGDYEIKFIYDEDRYAGRGMLRAVKNVNEIIAPALKGMEVTRQREMDEKMLKLDGTPDKSRLGGNAIGSVSAAVLKAGARSLGLPLYQYIGGVNACILPVTMMSVDTGGSRRYGGGERGGGKPVFEFMSYGAKSFSECLYMNWTLAHEFNKRRKPLRDVKDDEEILEEMTATIEELGYSKKVGFHIDVAGGCFYGKKKGKFIGLFSRKEKTKEDMIELYKKWITKYPIVDLEDPLDFDDLEGHVTLVKELRIQITGDDLFATGLAPNFRKAIEMGVANAMVLKVNQIGSITEAFDAVQYICRHGYRVFPGASRGEGADLADYAVGLGAGLSKSASWNDLANRYLAIEGELDSSAKFLGIKALNLRRSP